MAKDIGLHINSDMTEYMCLNHENQINMKILACHDIKRVEECKYLDSYIGSTQHDVSEIPLGRDHVTNNKLYCRIPRITDTIRE